MEAQKPYGKPLFFSKMQMVPVKNEPIAEQEAKPDGGNRELGAGNRRRKTK